MKKFTLVFVTLLLAMMLAACSGTAGSEPTAVPEMEATAVPAAEEPMPVITGILWQWQEFQDTAGENDIVVDNPANYNIVFNEDGTYNGQADCNRIAGSYTLDGASLTIQPGISTMAMCPEGSLDTQFNAFLSNVRTFVMDGEDLVMNLFADAGNMVFSNGGPAPVTMAEVTGTVSYLVRIALPEDANLLVQLRDTSLADAPALVMGEYNAPTNGAQVPLPFAIPYDPAAIVDNHTYTLSARITDGAGNLLFINDTSIPVITRGNPTTDVEVLVVQVNP